MSVLNCVVVTLLLFALSCNMQAQGQVIVDAKLDRAEILIGEHVRLTTTVTVGNGQKVKFPQYNQADTLVKGVEYVGCGEVDTLKLNSGQRLQLKRDYLITSFDSALYALPPMEVEVDGKSYKSRGQMGLKVGTVPVDTVHVDQFAPPYAVTVAPFKWKCNLLALSSVLWLFVIAIFALAIRLSSKKPVRRRVVIPPPVPPYKKASAKLDELKPQIEKAFGDQENKQFFIQLTDIVKVYLKERYDFNALESTTQEIIDGLREKLDDTATRQLKEVFTTADFVKFAKHTATDVERKRCFDAAADFLRTTLDEVMEQPKPTITYVTYSDTRQHNIRVALWCLLCLTFVGCAVWCVWMVTQIYHTFFYASSG